jgi:hypothetical protein
MAKKSTKHSNRSSKSTKHIKSKPKQHSVAAAATATAVAEKPAGKKPANITQDQYNDPKHNYLHYWDGRDYEDAAERLAISRLLKGKHFRHAVDIGGGYGRLCIFLENYADKVTLTDPTQQQLDIGK